MILIKNIEVFGPQSLGVKDIFIGGDRILQISSKINLSEKNFHKLKIIDGAGLKAIPGIIDLHVHIAGGGGEGGYHTRTPELMLTDLTLNGITTVIGLLGTDGTTRSMANLLAKARALEFEGLSTFIWTGCYEAPTRTITDSARNDITLIDKIIGIGEIAVSDHRGSNPSDYDLIHLASEGRVGGLLSGKCGVLHMHLGDGKAGLKPIINIIENSDIPYENLLPTHINRNKKLFNESIEYCQNGGYVDITTGIKPLSENSIEVSPVIAYKEMLNNKVSPYNITMSSDGGGSMPIFDDTGRLIKLTIGKPSSNFEYLYEAINCGIDIETALIPITTSPAKLLKLRDKGSIEENKHADIVLIDKNYKINSLISRGKILIENYKPSVYGTFEK